MKEDYAKRDKKRLKKLNILRWQEVVSGRGIKIAVIGGEKGNHHNGVSIIKSVAPNAQIIEYDVEDAMNWADALVSMINERIDIVCCSLRKKIWNDELDNLSRYMYKQGVVMIDYAGNEGDAIEEYPALSEYWFTVGAYDDGNNSIDMLSTVEGRIDFSMYIDFAILHGDGKLEPIGDLSATTQIPCGIVALLKEYYGKGFDGEYFKDFIKRYARSLDKKRYNTKSGYGLLALPRALPDICINTEPEDSVVDIEKTIIEKPIIREGVEDIEEVKESTVIATHDMIKYNDEAIKGSIKLTDMYVEKLSQIKVSYEYSEGIVKSRQSITRREFNRVVEQIIDSILNQISIILLK